MKYIIYLTIVLLVLSGCSRSSVVRFNTKQDLINNYITSVNNKDIEMLKKAYHPRLLKMITDDNTDFFNDFFAKELGKSIPSDRSVSYRLIGDGNDAGLGNLIFTLKDAFDYPIFPTLICEIDYNESEYSSVTKFLYLSDTREGWFLVFGIPNQQTLVQYREAKIEKEKKSAYVAETIDNMDSQVYANIIEQLKQKSLKGAVSIFKQSYGQDSTNAALVVEEIRHRENLEW